MPESFNKLPEVTLAFWVIKIAATTLGETGGDTVTTMTLNWGYLAGTALFLAALAVLVSLQITASFICIQGNAVLGRVYSDAATGREGWRFARQAQNRWRPCIKPPVGFGGHCHF